MSYSFLKKSLMLLLICGLLALWAEGYQENVSWAFKGSSSATTLTMLPVQTGSFVTFSKIGTAAVFDKGIFHDNYEVVEEALPIHLYDVATGQELLTLTGHSDYVSNVAFTTDGQKLASYQINGYIFLWDITSGTLLKTIPTLRSVSTPMNFLPDGKTLVVQYSDYVFLWDTETESITGVLQHRYRSFSESLDSNQSGRIPDSIGQVAISDDGRYIAALSSYENIWLWNINTGEERTLQEQPIVDRPPFNIRRIMFSHDSQKLVYLDTSDYSLHFLDITNGEETNSLPLVGNGIRNFALSLDNQQVAWISTELETAGQLAEIYLMDIANPSSITVLRFPELESFLAVNSVITFSDDDQNLLISDVYDDLKNNYILNISLGDTETN